jgi:hypothetical protein
VVRGFAVLRDPRRFAAIYLLNLSSEVVILP